MQTKFSRFFLFTALVFLTLTGAAKLISAFGTVGILSKNDPVLEIPTRWLLILAGGLEMAVVAGLLFSRRRSLLSMAVAVLGAQFLLYRAVFQIGQYSRGCPCLGDFTEWAHLPDLTINRILLAVAGWLCIGGLISAFLSLAQERKQVSNLSTVDEQRLVTSQ